MRRLAADPLRAPALPPAVVLPLTLAFGALTLTRGTGWLFGQRPGTVSDLMLDNGVGLKAWGAVLTVGALGLFAAYAWRRHFPVWCAHGFLFATYFGITITTLDAALRFGGGWEHLAAPVGGCAWHAVLSRTMRPFPRSERSRPRAD